MIEAAISARLNNRKGFIGSELQIQPSSMNVSLIGKEPHHVFVVIRTGSDVHVPLRMNFGDPITFNL